MYINFLFNNESLTIFPSKAILKTFNTNYIIKELKNVELNNI